jgi:uncharacterized protein with PIN domain
MNCILITDDTLERVASYIGYNISKINAIEILDLEKLIELRVLEAFKRCDVCDNDLVEVYCKNGGVVIASGEAFIYTDKFFKDLKVEKNKSFPKYRLPPGKK